MVKWVFLRYPQENTLLVFFNTRLSLYLAFNFRTLESPIFLERLYDQSNHST